MRLETPKQLIEKLLSAGHSQTVIGKRAGVEQPTISRILSGEHNDPKSSVLINLYAFADEVLPKEEEQPHPTNSQQH